MVHLIDKDALVAEIKKLKNTSLEYGYNTMQMVLADTGKDIVLGQLQQFLDTLEVKEVDEPTAADRGMAEEIIINLKRVEQDYRIDLTKEMKWLRNKAQKGE